METILQEILRPQNQQTLEQATEKLLFMRSQLDFLQNIFSYLSKTQDQDSTSLLLSQIKYFSNQLQQNQICDIQYIVQTQQIVNLTKNINFDLSIEALFSIMKIVPIQQLSQIQMDDITFSAVCRRSRAQISSRKFFDSIFLQNYQFLLNENGFYGLLDSLFPFPPVSYIQCLPQILQLCISKQFVKNDELLRVILQFGVKMKRVSSNVKKEYAQYIACIQQLSVEIKQFAFINLQQNTSITDNLLICKHLINLNIVFSQAEIQNIIEYSISVFKYEFKQNWSEDNDFSTFNILESLLEEDNALLGASCGVFMAICSTLSPEVIKSQLQNKCEILFQIENDFELFFIENLQLILMIKSYKKLENQILEIILKSYMKIYATNNFINTWSCFAINQIFPQLINFESKNELSLVITNNIIQLLPNLSSKIQIIIIYKLLFNRINQIQQENLLNNINVLSLANYSVMLLASIPETHYIFTTIYDIIFTLIQNANSSISDLGNNIIQQFKTQYDKLLQILPILNELELQQENADFLFQVVSDKIIKLANTFPPSEYSVLLNCSHFINLYVYNTKISPQQAYTLFESFLTIMFKNSEFFAEILEGLLAIQVQFNFTIDQKYSNPPSESVKFVLICLQVINNQRSCFGQFDVSQCEIPQNWVFLVLSRYYIDNNQVSVSIRSLISENFVLDSHLSRFLCQGLEEVKCEVDMNLIQGIISNYEYLGDFCQAHEMLADEILKNIKIRGM